MKCIQVCSAYNIPVMSYYGQWIGPCSAERLYIVSKIGSTLLFFDG